MMTRQEAVDTIWQAVSSRTLGEKLEEDLIGIAKCIEAEETHNVFLWGADDDYILLFIDKRSSLLNRERALQRQALYEKYRIREVELDEDEEEASES